MSQVYAPTSYLSGVPHSWLPKVISGDEIHLGPLRCNFEVWDATRGLWKKPRVSRPEGGTLIRYIAAVPGTRYRVKVVNTAPDDGRYTDSVLVEPRPDDRPLPTGCSWNIWPQAEFTADNWDDSFSSSSSGKLFVWAELLEAPASSWSSSSSSGMSQAADMTKVGKFVLRFEATRRVRCEPYTVHFFATSSHGPSSQHLPAGLSGKAKKVRNCDGRARRRSHLPASSIARLDNNDDLPATRCGLPLQGRDRPRDPTST